MVRHRAASGAVSYTKVVRPELLPVMLTRAAVRIPEVDTMLDEAIVEQDEAARNKLWAEIDRRVMEEAVIYPGVYAKAVLLRGTNINNVFVNESFGYYDYTAMGVNQ